MTVMTTFLMQVGPVVVKCYNGSVIIVFIFLTTVGADVTCAHTRKFMHGEKTLQFGARLCMREIVLKKKNKL